MSHKQAQKFFQIPLVFLCLFVALFFTGCSNGRGPLPIATPAPSAPAAATPANTYQGVGIVKSINPNVPAIEIDHEEIVGLMQGMQMEFPVTDRALLNGLAVNDRIDFTIDNSTGEMKIIAIKKK